MDETTVEISEPKRTRDWKLGTSISFLGLPVELRLLIYKYLIPERTGLFYVDRELKYELRPIRYDQQPCFPAILRVNHQIYDELIGMWYGTADFSIRIIWRALFFLQNTITTRDTVLTRNFSLIRSLHISLNLDQPQSIEPDSYDPPIPWIKLITDRLAIGSNKLTEISLSGVVFTPRGRNAVVERWASSQEIGSILEWNLGLLRNIRGIHLSFDHIHSFQPRSPMVLQCMMDESGQSYQTVSRTLRRMERVRARFLKALAEDMSKNT